MAPATTPTIIYGTAWKKEATQRLVEAALRTGFLALDTANQPKHYNEPLVGAALSALGDQGFVRERLFLQTKFTPADGHDERVPYDVSAPLTRQVGESLTASLRHLRTNFIDSYLLHGPYGYPGLSDSDWEVWTAMEEHLQKGTIGRIGISNVNARQLEELVRGSRIAPHFVQNRCYASRAWDADVREVCAANGILYQGFSLLTANPSVVRHPMVESIALRLEATPAQVLYRFAIGLAIIPLTGTTNERHMLEALRAPSLELTPSEISAIAAFH